MPRDRMRDPRLCFKYDACWSNNEEAKTIIKEAWQRGTRDTMEKIKMVGVELGRWQYEKQKRMRKQIGSLQASINSLVNIQGRNDEGNMLKDMRSKLGRFDLNLDYIDSYISGEANERLLKDFTDNEIKKAFNQMDPRKAPGGGKDVDYLNDTIIVLIPKIKEPVDLTNFRPISLCRVVYKIIAKVLANRLTETLPLCISQNQSAFVPGRIIHDNILVAHEMVHYLQSTKNGPNKGFVIKLDMSKAYDRVEWDFIEEVTNKIGYANEWVKKIMRCVRSVRYVVKCNSILSETIVPERGLRQGDPLSPYLFLFCMEAFSKLLTRAQNNNMIKGIRASINGPRINHLFFVDDALFFIRNKKHDVEEFRNILTIFCRDSGQDINKDKSMIMFSPKTPDDSRQTFISMLGMRTVDKLDNYLGLPLHVGRKKSLAFTNIINRCICRVKGWSKLLLPYGGKEVFLKAIMQAIPTYAFLVFLAPKGIIEELYWWNNKDKTRGWTMMAWDKMSYPKGMGGLGFRDLQLFNIALLGRQVWLFIICNDTLCYKVLARNTSRTGMSFTPRRLITFPLLGKASLRLLVS
ncbi:reverse transcriptase [Gossypium australe]|uniref:Reverse transcriptase n=1 Tax=Gossypium australe TaxID=47621 RepID=A0A5B6VJS5_9ROSI|nr:reverse transcriptase [Gossypium australe]